MKRTEAELLSMLERRYRGEQSGNGPAWAFIPHVRNAAGFAATRTADAIAMALWPSRGLELHGFEIKCDRRDWMRELAKPEKAETFIALCDRWWVVAGDAQIVKDGELPAGWGLVVARGDRLQQVTPAAMLPAIGDSPFTATGRSFLAALLRSAARTQQTTPEEVASALKEAKARWEQLHADDIDGWRAERDGLRKSIREFEQASGVSLTDWRGDSERPAQVGAALRLLLNGDADLTAFENRLRSMLRTVDGLADELRKALEGRAETG